MAFGDCPKCGCTPCKCGWDYQLCTNEYMSKLIADILTYRTDKFSILENAKNILKSKEK